MIAASGQHHLARIRPERVVSLVLVHTMAIAALFRVDAQSVALCVVLYALTMGPGVTLGYHRLLSHRSFRVPAALEHSLAFLGCLSLQGGPIEWAGTHRLHHRYADQPGDPHDSRRGFWHSHLLWLLRDDAATHTERRRMTADLRADDRLAWLDRHYAPLQLLLAVGLGLTFGLNGVLWGVGMRLALTWHVTWSINSVAHRWGHRDIPTRDRSVNNALLALLSFGEGWHNNHHARPASARHGWRWWQLDLTWIMIRGLERLGLATHVKRATGHRDREGRVSR